jgi:large subunit ribosomal protein L1
MDKELIAATLKKLKENSPKRNFKQNVDLIINFRGLDLKKPDHQINMFVALNHETGKKISVCALVGLELESNAKQFCDEVIPAGQFDRFKGKAEIKKLARKHNFFIAQASIMPKVASVFGRFLGPKGKMPNPKIGCVLPPNANIKPLYERLKRTVNVVTRNEPAIKCMVGKEGMDADIIDNILTIYNSVIQKLPGDKQNVKSVMLKLTMGPSFKVGEESGAEKEKSKRKKSKSSEKGIKGKDEAQEKKSEEQAEKAKIKEPKENKKDFKK